MSIAQAVDKTVADFIYLSKQECVNTFEAYTKYCVQQ